MDYLGYQQTNNKVFKTYYDRFKKMVKQDLSGNGWFLLVKDFPFKDGDNLMFTAGEDIGKWGDKNLVSLYGKTNYIIGRCRKRGPVLTLLDFQEGDYIKVATESGLRKELKEYFKGTGVSVRVFKSLKVTEKEPEEEEERDETESQEAAAGDGRSEEAAEAEPLVPDLPTPTSKRSYIMKVAKEIPKRALACGLSEDPDFKKHWMNLNRLVRLGKVNDSLEIVEQILQLLKQWESKEGNTGNKGAARALEIEEELAQLTVAEGNLRRDLQQQLTQLAELMKTGKTHKLKQQLSLIENSEKSLNILINQHAKQRRDLEQELSAIR